MKKVGGPGFNSGFNLPSHTLRKSLWVHTFPRLPFHRLNAWFLLAPKTFVNIYEFYPDQR